MALVLREGAWTVLFRELRRCFRQLICGSDYTEAGKRDIQERTEKSCGEQCAREGGV